MKKTLNIMFLLILTVCYGQNYSAYRKLEPIKTDFGAIARQYSNSSNNYNYSKNKAINEQKKYEYFTTIKDLGLKAFEKNNYIDCIYYYEQQISKKYFDSYFEYGAGVSYYRMWEQTDKLNYKKKAKNLLKKSSRHGYIKSELFLDQYY